MYIFHSSATLARALCFIYVSPLEFYIKTKKKQEQNKKVQERKNKTPKNVRL